MFNFAQKKRKMAIKKEHIEHEGTITKITSSSIFARILAKSGCASCDSKAMCNLSEMEEKIIEITINENNHEYALGETITILLKRSQGNKAVLFAYFLPFLLIVACLLVVLGITGDEGLAGLSSILIVIPYFMILYFYRDKLKSKFEFHLK